MAQLQKGFTFADGNSYTAANLNTLVDSGLILPGAVTEQVAAAPVSSDSFMYFSAAAGTLRKCTLQDIINSVPSNAAAITPSLRTLGTSAASACAGNDVRIPSNVTGIRLGAGAGSNDLAAGPKDFAFPSNLSGGNAINWDGADSFFDTLSGGTNRTFTFTNVRQGRVITVTLRNFGYTGTIAWPALVGTVPPQPSSAYNIYVFSNTGLGTTGVWKGV